MSSFMQRARDRAQEAAARAQSLAQDGAARLNASTGGGSSSGSTAGGGKAPGSPGGTPAGVSGYSGSLPHVLRQGLAQYYPRSDSDSRANYILKNALKGMILDHAATARETKTAAHATYSWGVEQDPKKSEEGQGDAALVDVADRLAFMLQTISDLEQAHVGRAENARATFKRIAKAERELAPKRERRAKLRKELHTLMPEQAKGNTERIAPLQQRLKEWQEDDREEEEELGRLKRECLRDSYEAHFDSLIELGEKLAIVARHGKLLTHQIPVGTPVYPAPRNETSWAGASRTAAIRAALPPALAGYQPGTQLPELAVEDLASGTSGASSLHSADTISYGESHAEELSLFNQGTELHDDDDGASAHHGGSAAMLGAAGTGGAAAYAHSSSASTHSDAHAALAPSSLGGGPTSPSLLDNINNGPAELPPSPSAGHGAAQRHRVPPLPSPSAGGGSSSSGGMMPPPPQHETDVRGDLADGPSVAETGKPIVGPGGPSSGTLQPRVPRRSSAASSGAAINPFGDAASAPLAGGAGSSSMADAHARKEAEAAKERKEAEAQRERDQVAAQAVQARIRRDGTVVRRGEQGYEEAEEEGLPAYHV